jgi:hypothetical protein
MLKTTCLTGLRLCPQEEPTVISTDGRRLAVFFLPRKEQTVQQTLSDSATIIRGTTSMLPDQSAVYYSEELSLLGQILDQAVQSLPLSMRTPQNRAAIAKNILACAATGERDPIELRLAALINLKVTVAA